jgi:transcriptional regulator with XRE-family HTH domain
MRSADAIRTDRLVGARLRQERLLAAISRARLAAAIGITEQILRRHEAGELRLEPRTLVRAVAALGIPLSFFCYDLDEAAADIDGEAAERRRWRAVPRPLTILGDEKFARVERVIALWHATRGVLGEELPATLSAAGLMGRSFLLRCPPSTTRLMLEFCAPAVRFLRPCESLLMVGREFHDMPDRDYGAWVAEAYGAALTSEAPSVQSVRAEVRASDAAIVRARYDRVLLPWRSRGERFVLGLSLEREAAILR